MRTPIIAGNWKMHKDIQGAIELVKGIQAEINETDVEVVVCCPFTSLSEVKKVVQGSKLKLGAQNIHFEDSGAFTGEISADMLVDIGVEYVIVGHSERRQYFYETDEIVNKKVKKALEKGLKPILCIGETLEEREADKTFDVVKEQLLNGLAGVQAKDLSPVVIAYEPIWAIGTGKTATSEEANQVIAFIREVIQQQYDDSISEEIRIQYGGSVKAANATEIMNQADIDGALVGGASLKLEDFLGIIRF